MATLDDVTLDLLGPANDEPTPAPALVDAGSAVAEPEAPVEPSEPSLPAASPTPAASQAAAPDGTDGDRQSAARLFAAMKDFDFIGPKPTGIKLLENADDRPAYEALRMMRLAGFALAETQKLMGELRDLNELPAKASAHMKQALMGPGGLVERLTALTGGFGPALSKTLRDTLVAALEEYRGQVMQITASAKDELDEHKTKTIRDVEQNVLNQVIVRLGETIGSMTEQKVALDGREKDLQVKQEQLERDRLAAGGWTRVWPPLAACFLGGLSCSLLVLLAR